MTLGPLQTSEEDRLERPVPRETSGAEGKGGILKWGIAALALFAFAGSVWYAYERGAQDASGDFQPPLIKADPRPTKLRPDDPGGLQVPNRDKLVYERLSTDQPDKRVERLLPPAEAPGEKPTSATEDTESPVAQEEGPAISVGTTAVVPPQAMAATKPPPTRSETLKLSLDPATGEVKLPAADAAPSGSETPAGDAAPTPIVPAVPAAEEPSAPQPVAALAPKQQFGVQLAALRDEAGVPNEWRRLQAAFGSILGKLESHVVRADLGQRGVFYRLVAGRFANEAAARTACDELQALKQDCLVVKLD